MLPLLFSWLVEFHIVALLYCLIQTSRHNWDYYQIMPQERALGLAGDIQSDDELDDAEFEQQSLIDGSRSSLSSATTRRQLVAPTSPTSSSTSSSSTSSSPLCKLFAGCKIHCIHEIWCATPPNRHNHHTRYKHHIVTLIQPFVGLNMKRAETVL